MSDHFYLTENQLGRIKSCFVSASLRQLRIPKPHGVPRVDDRRALSSIIHVLKRGLQWRDAPAEYSPHKTLYNRFIRWREIGVSDKIFKELSSRDIPQHLQIDASHLKAHRTASSLLKKGMFLPKCYRHWPNKRRDELQATCCV